MMATRTGFYLVVLLSFVAAVPARSSETRLVLLPPENVAYQYVHLVEELHTDQDHAETFELPDNITALQSEDSFKLPGLRNYKAACVGQSADSMRNIPYTEAGHSGDSSAIGKDGKLFKEGRIPFKRGTADVEESCVGEFLGESCWMAVANHTDCRVWNPDLRPDETVIWTGSCSGNLAEGKGTIIWTYVGRDTLETTEAGKGRLQKGKYHGHWIEHYWDGTVGKGTYADGKRHGQWDYRYPGETGPDAAFLDGNNRGQGVYYETNERVWGGRFVAGKKQGQWRECYPRGVQKASFVDSSRRGHWVWIYENWFGAVEDGEVSPHLVYGYNDGTAGEGPYVDGKKHGHWVFTDSDSSLVEEGPYVEGRKHGHWARRQDNGYETEGLYVDNRKHGLWVVRYPFGSVEQGPYVNGKKHGHWVERQADGKGWGSYDEEHVQWLKRETEGTEWGGPYVNDKKHGHWIERDLQGGRSEGRYLDGEKHGHWVRHIGRRDYVLFHIESEEGSYLHGKKTGHWVTLFCDGSVEEGNYTDDKRDGRWVMRHRNGDVEYTEWIDGKRHGGWLTRHLKEYQSKGRYIDGEKDGVWYKWLKDDRACWSATFRQGAILENKVVNQEMCRR